MHNINIVLQLDCAIPLLIICNSNINTPCTLCINDLLIKLHESIETRMLTLMMGIKIRTKEVRARVGMANINETGMVRDKDRRKYSTR